MIKKFKWLFLVAATFIACESEEEVVVVPDEPLTAGTANFSKYVALGNSLTAGFSDNALFIEGQKGSYTNLLAQQFAKVGGGEFKIPLMADNVGGFSNLALGQFPRLVFNGAGPVSIGQAPYNQVSTTSLAPLTGGFDNLGVPGAKSFHLLSSSYGNPAGIGTFANPYFVRFASSTSASILGDALARNHTFFSLWIGNNDVLSYATSGGIGTNQLGNLNPASYGSNDITDPNVFASVYNTLLDGTNGLTKNGAKGVVANLPYVTSVPFFTTVPTNPVPGLPAANATSLNQLFGGINAALAGANLPARFVTLTTDDGNPATVETNPLLIIDESQINISGQIASALTPVFGAPTATFLGNVFGQARHAKRDNPSTPTVEPSDYILLSARGVINTTTSSAPSPFNIVGISFPMQDATTLTIDEVDQIKTATDAFNASIKSLADAKGLAFVDANALLRKVATTGVSANGFNVKATYVTGGGFSMDGVHPSSRGYALIANAFMTAINEKYGSNLKPVDISKFRIQFPASL